MCAFLFLALLISYLGFFAYFAICKSQKLANLNRAKVDNRNIDRAKKTHERILGELLLKQGSNKDFKNNQELLSKQTKMRQKNVEAASKIDK